MKQGNGLQEKEWVVLGLMSGTSLDGTDLAACRFWQGEKGWGFEVLAAETVPYPAEWAGRLGSLMQATALEYVRADAELGTYYGQLIRAFTERYGLRPLLVASHGHTIFHRPDRGFTAQIGSGAHIAAACGLPVVNDFRPADVALGGQGAPLVPAGEALLFQQYAACLNLGGIANITLLHPNQPPRAFDVSVCNIALNHVAGRVGLPFDQDGQLAASGEVLPQLLERLNALPFFDQPPPKSLGREWTDSAFLPLLDKAYAPADLLRTLAEHIAMQVGRASSGLPGGELLITGGGAFHRVLTERIAGHVRPLHAVCPEPLLVGFKEAIVFAFLGLLRWLRQPNCLASVTGASRDHCGGAVWWL